MRGSFGFPNTNYTVIENHKFRLNPGLDNERDLARYGAFFQATQGAIDSAMNEVEAKKGQLLQKARAGVIEDLKIDAIIKVEGGPELKALIANFKAALEATHLGPESPEYKNQVDAFVRETTNNLSNEIVKEAIRDTDKMDELINKHYEAMVDMILSEHLTALTL